MLVLYYNKGVELDMLEHLVEDLEGDIKIDKKTKRLYSHDTSLFEVIPKAVVFPWDVDDVKKVVNYVRNNKKKDKSLSITARSGGTDMSGGAINDSLILVFDKYINKIGEVKKDHIVVEPGAYYRDFEKVAHKSGLVMPSYPASKEIAAIGGMVANRAGGEKSLIYGTTEKYVRRLKVVLSDGNEYEFMPINEKALKAKMTQRDLEGKLYREVFKLIDKNYDAIQAGRPKVTKNTTGYALWDVWDKKRKVFDMTKLFVGSQGTLGLITEVEMALVHEEKKSGLLIGYMASLDELGEVIDVVLKHKPSSLETFDDHTLKFAIKFFFQFRKTLGFFRFAKLGLSFLPDVWIMIKELFHGKGMPKLIMLMEFEGDNQDQVTRQIDRLKEDLRRHSFDMNLESAETAAKSERFWLMRHESFNLLRNNVKGDIHTAPFIDDLIVPPKHLTKFLPEFREILERYELLYTIAGHMGNGNFHVIPLMDFSDKTELNKIEPALRECIDLVKKYEGSMSGEHNDGMIRGPFLELMYGKKIFGLFGRVKKLFDPDNIFNPHKKTDADWKFSKKHMRSKF